MKSHDWEEMPKQPEFENVAPNASAMIESMRAYGYSLPAAIADIIDNSIAAECSRVSVDMHWAGKRSWIAITDDGHGMTQERLRDAMRLGSTNPLDRRDANDLGRFGLGLKTASLSQCRRVTVASKRVGGAEFVRRWDLDHLNRPDVEGWQLLTTPHHDAEITAHLPSACKHGTRVLWEVLDRLVGESETDDVALHRHFQAIIEAVHQHLAMVFHRYLERKRGALGVVVNGRSVAAWNPFLEDHASTQVTPEELIPVHGFATPVRVRGYVLPHKDKLGNERHAEASGPRGWNAQQGFYVYRNERLIVSGSWLGLGGVRPWMKEEHYKLSRIKVDIPNSMDHLWHLDVKKSSAEPPPQLRKKLTGLAKTVRDDARNVYSHRGKYGKRAKNIEHRRPWTTISRDGVPGYRIDRAHPLVEAFLHTLPKDAQKEFSGVLEIIERTVPVERIWLDSVEHPDSSRRIFYGSERNHVRALIEISCSAIERNRKVTRADALAILATLEEFSDEESQAIIASMGETK